MPGGNATPLNSSGLVPVASYLWDTGTLAWIKATGSAVAGNVNVTNFPATYDVTQITSPWVVSGAVSITGAVAVTGPLTDAQLRALAVPVSGTFFQATQPVSAVALPLPAGAATSALQTQPGVDIGDVTVNNAAGAGAVNIQDGGNSITVDAFAFDIRPLAFATDKVDASGSVVTASSAATATEQAPLYTEGDTAAAFSQDLDGNLRTRNDTLLGHLNSLQQDTLNAILIELQTITHLLHTGLNSRDEPDTIRMSLDAQRGNSPPN